MLMLWLVWSLMLGSTPQEPPTAQPGYQGGLVLGEPRRQEPEPLDPKPIEGPEPLDPFPWQPTPDDPEPIGLARCGCVTWTYEPNPGQPPVVAFHILVSETSGAYDPTQVRAKVAAVPKLITELACERLYLYKPGRYYGVIQAVTLRETSEYSNEFCVVVQDGDIYGCGPVNREMTCQDDTLVGG